MDGVRQRRQSYRDIFAEMDAQRAAVTFRENGKIAARLSGFYHAKSVSLTRNKEVHSIVASNLQENAGVGTALIGLSRGMKEARSKAQDGRDFFVVSHGKADGLEGFFIRFVHGEVAQHRKIITGVDAREVFLQDGGERCTTLKNGDIRPTGVQFAAIAGEKRRFRGELAARFVFGSQLARFHLAGLDIGLIEGVDAKERAGYGCSDFPTEKFLAEVVDIR